MFIILFDDKQYFLYYCFELFKLKIHILLIQIKFFFKIQI